MDVPRLPSERSLAYRGQFWLRLLGGLLLTASVAMVVLGGTRWADRMQGARYARYWSWCFLLAIAALLVALGDLLLVRRAGRKFRRKLFQEQFLSDEFLRKLRSPTGRRGRSGRADP